MKTLTKHLGILFTLYCVIRIWIFYSLPYSHYVLNYDSLVYTNLSQLSLLNYHLYFNRPFIYPLFLKLMQQNVLAVFFAQTLISIIAWFSLGYCIQLHIKNYFLRWLALLLILSLSCAAYLVIWDVKVLTESLSISLLAILISAFLMGMKTGFKARYLWLWIVTGFLLSNIRDTNTYFIFLMGMLIVVIAYPLRYQFISREKARLLLIATIMIFGISYVTALHRWVNPFCEILSDRINSNENAAHYFIQQGFPAIGAKQEIGCIDNVNNPQWATQFDWIKKHGKTLYVQYLVTHPTYTFFQYGLGNLDFWHGLLWAQQDMYDSFIAYNLPQAKYQFMANGIEKHIVPYAVVVNNPLIMKINALSPLVIPLFFILAISGYLLQPQKNSRDPIVISAMGLLLITFPWLCLLVWHADGNGVGIFRHQLSNHLQIVFALIVMSFKCIDNVLISVKATQTEKLRLENGI